jgi:hypothetical protein
MTKCVPGIRYQITANKLVSKNFLYPLVLESCSVPNSSPVNHNKLRKRYKNRNFHSPTGKFFFNPSPPEGLVVPSNNVLKLFLVESDEVLDELSVEMLEDWAEF